MGRRLVPAVINLTNYAIGATLMTIPYTFCECGLALALLLAGAIAALTVLASEMLLQAGLSQRRASYESLSMACFGSVGKAFLEFNMVGMMYGSLIAYVIILGDLGSEILHEQLGLPMNQLLRPLVLVLFGLLLIMPLSLKKNIDKLANASALSLLFYAILTIHLSLMPQESVPVPIVKFSELNWWRMSGIMNVIPIISLGFTIQSQVFPVFNSIPDSNSADMKLVIRISTVLVFLCYITVGIFGYWKFSQFQPKISADLLSMYPSSATATMMKIGFLASVAISYPLTVFPVRASLYSLFFIRGPTSPDIPDSDTIPDKQFNRITFGVIISSFVLGFLMNNIEVVLNLTGSLSGSVILFIFPALVSIKSKTMTKRRWVANFLLVFGVAILGLSFLNFWSNQELSKYVHRIVMNTLPADTAPPAIITSSSAAVAAGAPQVQRPSNHTVLKQ